MTLNDFPAFAVEEIKGFRRTAIARALQPPGWSAWAARIFIAAMRNGLIDRVRSELDMPSSPRLRGSSAISSR